MPDNAINPYSIILRPLVTEKSTALSAANKSVNIGPIITRSD